MNKADLIHVLDALEDAWEELDELMREKEWYVTKVTDKLESAQLLIREKLRNEHNYKR